MKREKTTTLPRRKAFVLFPSIVLLSPLSKGNDNVKLATVRQEKRKNNCNSGEREEAKQWNRMRASVKHKTTQIEARPSRDLESALENVPDGKRVKCNSIVLPLITD